MPDPNRQQQTAADRGGADAYYRRRFNPHKVVDGQRVYELTDAERAAYVEGYQGDQNCGDCKDWG